MSRNTPDEGLHEVYRKNNNRLRSRSRQLIELIHPGSSKSPTQLVTAVRLVMAVVVVSAGVVALIGMGTQPALAVSVSASDISVTTSDGNLTAVSVTPQIDVTWSGLDTPLHDLTLGVSIAQEDSNFGERLVHGGEDYTAELECDFDSHPDCGNASGSVSFSVPKRNILNGSHYYATTTAPFNSSDFFASDGDTNTTTVYVDIRAAAIDSDNNYIKITRKELSFDVTVENTASNVSVAGDLNTSATD